MQICAVVVTKDNSKDIEDIIIRCRNIIEPHVFVIDEGSTDDTIEIARRAGAVILHNKSSKHSAVYEALNQLDEKKFTNAIVFKATEIGTFFPEQMTRFLDYAWNIPDAICVATQGGKKIDSPHNALASISGWKHLGDAWSGFRLYPIEETLGLKCKENGINFEAEVLVKAAWAGIKTYHIDVGEGWSIQPKKRTNYSLFGLKLMAGMLTRIPLLVWRRIIV